MSLPATLLAIPLLGYGAPAPHPEPVAHAQRTGCHRGPAREIRHGSRGRRAVALTFDDGPWQLTGRMLKVLRRRHAHATFFLIGRQISGHQRLVRRMVRDGHDVGNHTWAHRNWSRGGPAARRDLHATSDKVARVTGYRPCLFRAPGDQLARPLLHLAGREGMTTVQWDVNPADYFTPGPDAIVRRTLRGVRPGSIVLLHDGGGPRGGTLKALPRLIRGLRSRNFRLVTLSDLLGYRATT